MGKKSRRARPPPVPKACAEHIDKQFAFFYWDDAYTTPDGATLEDCLAHYGAGGWSSTTKDLTVALVYLSDDRDASNSWLLGLKRASTDVQCLSRAQEETPTTYQMWNDPHVSNETGGSSYEHKKNKVLAALEDARFQQF